MRFEKSVNCMRPEHFHYLLEINRLHSISSAAKTLHMKQTTLSSIVKSAEEELGFPIFRRASTGVATTVEGERLMALAWEINVKYEELLSLKSRQDSRARPVRVLMSPSINAMLSIPLCKRFYQFGLRGDLIFEECPTLEVSSNIIQNTANIGISYLTPLALDRFYKENDPSRVQARELLRDRFYLLVAKDHPLAGHDHVSVGDISDEWLATVTNFQSNDKYQSLGAWLRGFSRFISYPNIAVMKQAVLQQNMIGILTGGLICCDGSFDSARFQAIPICSAEGENQISVYLMCSADRSLRYQERILITCIEDILNAFSHSVLFTSGTAGNKRENLP